MVARTRASHTVKMRTTPPHSLLPVLFLVPVLPKTLFTLVRRNLLPLPLSSARHSRRVPFAFTGSERDYRRG